MKHSVLMAGALVVAMAVVPMMAFAGNSKPYQRFDQDALYENVNYKIGQSFCVTKRERPDAERIPFVQFKVMGQDNLNVERFGSCDPSAIMHMPEKNMEAQVRWENTHGRKLFTRHIDDLYFRYSPGAVICDGYTLRKVDRNGHLKGTGRTCGVIDTPSFDPR